MEHRRFTPEHFRTFHPGGKLGARLARVGDLMHEDMPLVAQDAPMAEALQLLLSMLRDSGAPHKVVTQGGQYQQSLPQGKSYQLLRLRIAGEAGLVPGEFALVRIMGSDEHDLYGEVEYDD